MLEAQSTYVHLALVYFKKRRAARKIHVREFLKSWHDSGLKNTNKLNWNTRISSYDTYLMNYRKNNWNESNMYVQWRLPVFITAALNLFLSVDLLE